MATYSEKLTDPKWYDKRLEILERDENKCRICEEEKNLQVHYTRYFKNREPWEYDNSILMTLCKDCHEDLEEQVGDIKTLISLLQQDNFSMDKLRVMLKRKLSLTSLDTYSKFRANG